MKTFSQHKRTVAVLVIFSLIFALACLFPYIRFYRWCVAEKPATILVAVQSHWKVVAVFGGLFLCWCCLSFVASVNISRTSRIFGPYFGGILARIILFLELGGFVAIGLYMALKLFI